MRVSFPRRNSKPIETYIRFNIRGCFKPSFGFQEMNHFYQTRFLSWPLMDLQVTST